MTTDVSLSVRARLSARAIVVAQLSASWKASTSTLNVRTWIQAQVQTRMLENM